ncbi:MATE family efflux transporter [Sodalis-like secondary symbiont of Drepanosiphum platanoidis]|uniref:MATE family efflux transporter n=1 Tax=Sodalis-like secondary symbiont of Drepanosiphum platanoidis TaxID=2994493 RepID=UPI0034640C54
MKKYFKETQIILSLAIPVIFSQFSQTAMGVVDTIMSGSVSAIDMAAIAVGTSIWLPMILFGHGLIMALTPVIAQLHGSNKRKYINNQIKQGFIISIGISIIIMILLYNSRFIIGYMPDIEEELSKKAILFLRYLLWGTPGYLFFQVLRSQCEGLSQTKPGMLIGFFGFIINISINYILIYGKFGTYAFGGVGCGISTASVHWIMFLLLKFYTKKSKYFSDLYVDNIPFKPNWIIIKRLLSLGFPVALSLFFEVTLFALVALLIAPLGIIEVAGHQIALNFSSLMFVLPLSIGVSATIRVGFRLGEKKVEEAHISAHTTLFIGIILSCCTALFTAIMRKKIALLYNNTPEVVSVASHLMLLAALYQLSDSVQVIGNGILRGYKDTKSIFYITFSSYWLLGLPFGYILALTNIICPAMGPSGFWIGFIIGLTSSAILIMLRMIWIQNQTKEQILKMSSK